MRLGVFGSRSLGSKKVYERLKEEILRLREKEDIEMIVTAGEIRGVCKLARRAAQELKIPILLFFYDYERFQGGAFEHRSKMIINNSDFFLVVHDGYSQGTSNEVEMLEKEGKPYKYIKIEKENSSYKLDEKLTDFDWDGIMGSLGGDGNG